MSWSDVFHVEVDVSVLLQFGMPVIGNRLSLSVISFNLLFIHFSHTADRMCQCQSQFIASLT